MSMPMNGVTVYGKWQQTEYRVFLHPNAAPGGVRDQSLDWGSGSQQTNFRIAYNNKVSIPTGLRTGYEFIGWYKDAALTVPYNADTRLTDNVVPATPTYEKTQDWTDGRNGDTDVDMDKWGLIPDGATGVNKDVDRPWISRKLDLYCKWSKIVDGALGIYVNYDENGGSNKPTDALLYKESATAVAQTATTPADPTKDQFLYWVMQKYNETSGKYEDIPGSVVYPGQNFIVELENAKQIPDTDSEGNPKYDEHNRPLYIYTVQLRAEYGPLTPAKPQPVLKTNSANPTILRSTSPFPSSPSSSRILTATCSLAGSSFLRILLSLRRTASLPASTVRPLRRMKCG